MSDLITISSSVLPDSARVLGFRGVEAISRPYEIDVFLAVEQALGEDLDLADAISAKAVLTVDRRALGAPPFVFAGVFSRVGVVHAFGGHVLLHAVLVPRLWQLGLSRHSRIFTKMRVPDILREVLDEGGVTDVELRLGAYEVEEHVCQYKESDLAFISRWMEREGIFYFFEHGEDGEKLVLCDRPLYDKDPLGAAIRYFPQLGHDRSASMSFRAFRCRHSAQAASVRLKDYDYAKPNLNVAGAAAAADNGAGEVSVYGDRFFTPAAGERLAKIRAEALLAKRVVFQGRGTRTHLHAGATFEVEDHPFPSFNAEYLAVALRHSANQAVGSGHFREIVGIEHEDLYLVEVDAIPAATQFRAERDTPWPRVVGHENGVVDGPAESEYAQIDDQGRYNAKFKFDESKRKGGKATTFVRMAQPHGGDIEGFHFPLRKGTEVIFTFLGGDPDRPVIAGVVPNAQKPSAVTRGNYTKNVIQTGGRNRFEMEDKAGQQRITMSTPYAATHMRMGSPNEEHELIMHTHERTLLDAGLDFDMVISDAGHGDWNTTVHNGFATLDIPQGNYRLGIRDGIRAHAFTGLTLTINGSEAAPGTGGEGGLKIEILEQGAEVTAKKSISMTSHASDINVHATKDIVIASSKNHTVTVFGHTVKLKTGVSRVRNMADSFKLRKADKHEEFIGFSYSNTKGNSTKLVLGNTTESALTGAVSITVGDSTTTVNGDSTAIKLGAAASIRVGTGNSLTQSAGVQITIADKKELTLAVRAALELSIRLSLNFGSKLEFHPLNIENKMIDLKKVATKMGDALMDMQASPIAMYAFAMNGLM